MAPANARLETSQGLAGTPEGPDAGSVSITRAPGWSQEDCLAMSLEGEMRGLLGVWGHRKETGKK